MLTILSPLVSGRCDVHPQSRKTEDITERKRTMNSNRIRNRNGLARLAIGLAVGSILSTTTLAATFTVTHTGDSGAESLRQAILDANTNPGLDTIDFNIPGAGPYYTIAPLSALPIVIDPVSIDGTTQPGFTGNRLSSWMGPEPEVTGSTSRREAVW
jgi:hypothetical protein